MIQTDNRQHGVLRSLDWWTIGIYLALLTLGGSVSVVPATLMVTMIFSASGRALVCKSSG